MVALCHAMQFSIIQRVSLSSDFDENDGVFNEVFKACQTILNAFSSKLLMNAKENSIFNTKINAFL